jgi:hypothetical protein
MYETTWPSIMTVIDERQQLAGLQLEPMQLSPRPAL